MKCGAWGCSVLSPNDRRSKVMRVSSWPGICRDRPAPDSHQDLLWRSRQGGIILCSGTGSPASMSVNVCGLVCFLNQPHFPPYDLQFVTCERGDYRARWPGDFQSLECDKFNRSLSSAFSGQHIRQLWSGVGFVTQRCRHEVICFCMHHMRVLHRDVEGSTLIS